jgi:hypothetical protein
MLVCKWWMAPVCWADQAFNCKPRLICRIHDWLYVTPWRRGQYDD